MNSYPDPNNPYPLEHYDRLCFLKNIIDNHNIFVGDFTYYDDNALIMPGIKIGDGAIIAANSVVTKDVESYTIVGGNPAQLIRKRFEDEVINLLLELQWWHWSIKKITRNIDILCSNNLEKLQQICFEEREHKKNTSNN
ncbi:MAG TPA: hypothetical protein DCF68_06600 [Cyanothece sp. UBA12306]|nr:hypothetical protein [Cyanothece sp. UBA12306]